MRQTASWSRGVGRGREKEEKDQAKTEYFLQQKNDDLSNPVTKTKRNFSYQTELTWDAQLIHQFTHYMSFSF